MGVLLSLFSFLFCEVLPMIQMAGPILQNLMNQFAPPSAEVETPEVFTTDKFTLNKKNEILWAEFCCCFLLVNSIPRKAALLSAS